MSSVLDERFGRRLVAGRRSPLSLLLLMGLVALAIWVLVGLPQSAEQWAQQRAEPQVEGRAEPGSAEGDSAAPISDSAGSAGSAESAAPTRGASAGGLSAPRVEDLSSAGVGLPGRAPEASSAPPKNNGRPQQLDGASAATAPGAESVVAVSAASAKEIPAETQLDEGLGTNLSLGLEALRSGDLAAASAALEQAAASGADLPEVLELRRQVELALVEQTVSQGLLSARQQETSEEWSAAAASYGAVVAADPLLASALKGQERALARARLDAQLERTLAAPERLTTDAVLSEARDLLDRADAVTNKGPRLDEQVARLGRLIDRYDQVVTITLQSDGRTEVMLQRVGALGSFESKQLRLRPGRYTAIGRRDGYRDTRQVLEVSPDGATTFQVSCTQEIG
jgi:hypothetical protein